MRILFKGNEATVIGEDNSSPEYVSWIIKYDDGLVRSAPMTSCEILWVSILDEIRSRETSYIILKEAA